MDQHSGNSIIFFLENSSWKEVICSGTKRWKILFPLWPIWWLYVGFRKKGVCEDYLLYLRGKDVTLKFLFCRLNRYDNFSKMDPVLHLSVSDTYYTSRKNEQFPSLNLNCSRTFQNTIQTQIFTYICLLANLLPLTLLIILEGSPFFKPCITLLLSLFYIGLKVSKGYPVIQELFFHTFSFQGVCQHFIFHY